VRLEPLPVDHRKAALAEFEQLPTDIAAGLDAPDARSSRSLPASIRSLLYTTWRVMLNRGGPIWSTLPALATVVVVAFGFKLWNTTTATPATPIPKLMEDARKDLQNNRRAHAALLIAEAARRLGPNAVVAAQGEPAKQVYDALVALQPTRLGASGEPGAAQTLLFSPDSRRLVANRPEKLKRLFRRRRRPASRSSCLGRLWNRRRRWRSGRTPRCSWPEAMGALMSGTLHHSGAVLSLAFSRDSRTLASGSSIGTIYFAAPPEARGGTRNSGLATAPCIRSRSWRIREELRRRWATPLGAF